jgi:hypothetical protein
MARRHDSGYRDARLPLVHSAYDIAAPAAGMTLPFVEYDRGEALAFVNYIRRDMASLPKGPDVGRAYAAFGAVRGPIGTMLPFITAQYDPRNWAMQLYPHNQPARDLLATDGWLPCTEHHFARLLYRLRGKVMPDLAPFGVKFEDAPWLKRDGKLGAVDWPGQDMSRRRRNYEPVGARVPFSLRMPCADVDLAVIGRQSATVRLVVDYKLMDAYVDPKHKTHQAMSGLTAANGRPIPSMIVKYDPNGDRWKFYAQPLNDAASRLLADLLVSTNAVVPGWTPAAGEWVYLDEARWWDLLEEQRDS